MLDLKSNRSLIFQISAKNWSENSRSNKKALRNQIYTWKHFRNNLWVKLYILAADLHLSNFLYSKHRCNIWLLDWLGACKSKCVARIRIRIPWLAQRYQKSSHVFFVNRMACMANSSNVSFRTHRSIWIPFACQLHRTECSRNHRWPQGNDQESKITQLVIKLFANFKCVIPA